MTCARVVVLLVLCVFIVQCPCEYLNKKFCDDADPSQCHIYNVILEPCADGGSFCSIKRNKRYTLSVDFLPKFSAEKLNLSINGDDTNTGAFSKVVRAPSDACGMLTCPLEAQTRRIFDIDFSLGKTFSVDAYKAKFPVKVKLYNLANEKQGCCFTFNVKIMK